MHLESWEQTKLSFKYTVDDEEDDDTEPTVHTEIKILHTDGTDDSLLTQILPEKAIVNELVENAGSVVVIPGPVGDNVVNEDGGIVTEMKLVPQTADSLEGAVVVASGDVVEGAPTMKRFCNARRNWFSYRNHHHQSRPG